MLTSMPSADVPGPAAQRSASGRIVRHARNHTREIPGRDGVWQQTGQQQTGQKPFPLQDLVVGPIKRPSREGTLDQAAMPRPASCRPVGSETGINHTKR